ncbi:MAG: hypothetical protein HYX25_08680 [Candidatus Solibacter usitatus]|nr:hypothetical protein [Candidatus Solibacter usitatus]
MRLRFKENFDRFNYAIYKEKEMADFRRWIPVLAVLAIIIGTASTANAQAGLSCIAGGAVIPQLRSEGITELTGDLVYNCVGGKPTIIGQQIPRVNIQVFMNSPLAITSRLIGAGDEALLMIDEPDPADQLLCDQSPTIGCQLTGTGAGDAAQQAAYKGPGRFNVFQGVPAALNSVLFTAVPVDPPGTALDSSGNPLARVIRITNIRVNASAFHGAAGVTNLTALTSASPSQTLPINQQGIQTIGIILQGLVVSYTNSPQPGGFSYQQCFPSQTVNTDDNPDSFVEAGIVTFTEGFGTSFKTRGIGDNSAEDATATVVVDQNTPGQFFNTETGFYNSQFPGSMGAAPGGAGLADFGTRLKVTFTNIQAGVTITADAFQAGSGFLELQGTASEGGPYNPVGGFSFTATSSSNSFTWVWEVIDASLAVESVDIRFTASWSGPPNQPALGTSQISGWFAPTSTDTVAETEAVAPIPRFQDFSVNPDAFTIQKCQTHLLFPFVTNQLGFDTGIAITNTSTDQYGTTPQSGPCSLYFYGLNAPAVFTTPSDVTSAGGPFASTVLTMAPNFQGYIIADCDFQYAHGFAFVTKVGTTDVAMGYLALIIPDSPFGGARLPQDFTRKGEASGEQLTN